MTFKKFYLIYILLLIFVACSKGVTNQEENIPGNPFQKYTKSSPKVSEQQSRKILCELDYSVFDSLEYYKNHQKYLTNELCKDIFDQELSDIDKALVTEIRKSVKTHNLVITHFETVESDTKVECIALHFFDNKWTLQKSYAMDYCIHYDLYEQKHNFLNDSTLNLTIEEGINYDNDSTIRTIMTLQIDEKSFFDTLKIEKDTII